MTTDCIIENWIMKNKTWLWFLFGILGVWVVSVIGLMLFKCIRSDLLWNASRISLSDILSLGSTIGAIAVAVLAWMALKTGKDTYVEQKTLDRASFAIIEIVKQILLPIYSLLTTLTIANQKLASHQIAFDLNIEDTDISSGTISEYKAVIPLLESAIVTIDLFNSRECNYKVELAIIETMRKSIKLDAAHVIQLSLDLSELITKLKTFKSEIQARKKQLDAFCALTSYFEQSRYQDTFRAPLNLKFLNEYINSLPNKTLC
jgi:hypothetical protein